MFIGRERELDTLNKLYNEDKFQCVIIWGRRRVGKTTLINEFIKDKDCIYFTGIESTMKENLENFSRSIADYLGFDYNNAPVYSNFQNALDVISDLATEKQIVLVLDEYPYLAKSYSAISSILQHQIDHNFKKDTKLFIVLCGSSMSFMERQVLGYQSPLFGRRTAQMKVRPFDFFESLGFSKNFGNEDKAILYGMTGGVPQYLSFINENSSVKENIIKNFLSVNGYLFEEPTNLLKQELREPGTYNAIIRAIATGSSKSSEICTKVGLESAAIAGYLERLIELGIVKKEVPVGTNNSRKTIYSIEDNMFRFWYTFVPSNLIAIQRGLSEVAWKAVEKRLSTFMGKVFEQICFDYLWKNYETLPVLFQYAGRWWGSNPVLKREEEIDILAYNEEGQALLCECKWRNELVDVDVIKTLQDRGRLLPYDEYYYYVFAKRGFTERAIALAKESENIRLITFEEMFE